MSAVAIGVVLGVVGFLFILWLLCGITTVREKEVIIIERLGTFKTILTAGVHWYPPLIDSPRSYKTNYTVDVSGVTRLINKDDYRISLQHEVLDFPKQSVVTKDGAAITLDAVLSYQLASAASARTMVYSVNNLPLVLSRLMQAHIRNVAATLDVDKIIEDSAAMNVLTQLLNDTTMKWGVRINFVKIQRVDAHSLSSDLAKKKNADLTNKNVIITAKSNKQTTLLAAEGERDQMIKKAEGEAQKKISIATGKATAIVNNAKAEADALRKIIPMLKARDEDPIKYLLSQKYIDKLGDALQKAELEMVPMECEDMASQKQLGVLFTESLGLKKRNVA